MTGKAGTTGREERCWAWVLYPFALSLPPPPPLLFPPYPTSHSPPPTSYLPVMTHLQITTPEALPEESSADAALRPSRLDEFVGQSQVKTSLQIAIDAAGGRGGKAH